MTKGLTCRKMAHYNMDIHSRGIFVWCKTHYLMTLNLFYFDTHGFWYWCENMKQSNKKNAIILFVSVSPSVHSLPEHADS